MKHATKAQAEKVLTHICKLYGVTRHDKNGPKVVLKWDWRGDGNKAPAIVWEEGPPEWAQSYFDFDLADCWTEPMTTWALMVYPKP